MTNKEKAKEISDIYMSDTGFNRDDLYDAAMEMAEWKDKQVIEYLYENIQSLLKDYGVSEASADLSTQLFLVIFKRAMKGEQND